jgi:hypothetical protein
MKAPQLAAPRVPARRGVAAAMQTLTSGAGTLFQEEASTAHAVGLKQTILVSFATMVARQFL